MRTLFDVMWIAMLLVAAVAHSGCGADCGVGHYDLQDLSAPAGEGADCVTDVDCRSPQLLCAYAIADGCAAKGHCARIPTPTCASFAPLCGCDGNTVKSGSCFYQPGFAGGPTTGVAIAECGDGGTGSGDGGTGPGDGGT